MSYAADPSRSVPVHLSFTADFPSAPICALPDNVPPTKKVVVAVPPGISRIAFFQSAVKARQSHAGGRRQFVSFTQILENFTGMAFVDFQFPKADRPPQMGGIKRMHIQVFMSSFRTKSPSANRCRREKRMTKSSVTNDLSLPSIIVLPFFRFTPFHPDLTPDTVLVPRPLPEEPERF